MTFQDTTQKNRKTNITFLLIVGVCAIGAGSIILLQSKQAISDTAVYELIDQKTSLVQPTQSEKSTENFLVEPIAEFTQRITKKPFGIHITPETSPIQPERFSGFHTGVDVEYDDVADNIPVKAIADGIIVASQTVPGYGGVVAIQYELNNEQIIGLYGHLDNDTRLLAGTEVIAGQTIGFLGEDQSIDTDGERKHLHFGMIKGTTVNYKGYVDTESELSDWYDPLEFYE